MKLEDVFEYAKRNSRAVFIPYLTGGYPNMNRSLDLLEVLADSGADIIELGIPFSDPIADGVTIQEASSQALLHGATPKGVLRLVSYITSRYDVPIIVMTYINPVLRIGVRNFLQLSKESGVCGLIIPDLPLEEARKLKPIINEFGISLVLLASPTTNDRRLIEIMDESDGFVYLVSLKGTTGERETIPQTALDLIKRSRMLKPEKNLAIGFGISTPQQASFLVKNGADGIVVGSKLISIIKANIDNAEDALRKVVKEFLSAMHR